MARYGRFATSDPDMGTVVVGTMRACTYGIMPENGWGYSVGGHLGKQFSGDAPAVRFGLYTTSSGSPSARMGYTASEAVTAVMTSGSGGNSFTASWSSVGSSYGTTDGVKLSSGSRYAIGVLPSTDDINHGMIQAASISETYELFYNRTGLGTTPPDPFSTSFSSVEGWMSLWVNYDPNVAPSTPTGLSPTGTISSTTPTFAANFVDSNQNRGDQIMQYQLQLRQVGTTTNKWDTTYSASNTEKTNDAISRAYGGTAMTQGLSYEWRVRMSDQFGSWSSWTAWTSFTISGAGTVTLDGTPTGVQQAITGLTFQGRWTHQTALSTNAVQVRLLQNGSVIGTSGTITKTVASSAAPGTLFSVTSADTSLFDIITWGQSYEYQMRGRDTNNVWSGWSASRSFSTNAQPNTPLSLDPTSLTAVTTLPLLTCTMTDDDDTVATGLQCWAVLITTPVATNGSFALGNANNWGIANKHANATVTSNDVTYQSTTVYDGDGHAGQVAITASTVPGSATKVLDILHDDFFPIWGGEQAAFSIAVQTSNANLSPRRFINWYDASQVFISQTVETDLNHLASTWYKSSVDMTAPSTARYMKVGVAIFADTANQTGTIYVDDLDFFDITIRERQMTQVGGSTTRWQYQTVTDDLFQYNTYHWQAYGYDGSTEGPRSALAGFVYALGPVVTVTAPTEGATITTGTPTITWTVTDQQKYQVDIYSVIDGVTTLVYTSGEVVSTTGSHLVPSGYLLNTWTVTAYVTVTNSLSQVGTSSGRTFTIDYGDVDPVLGFEISTQTLRFDRDPSAILLSWAETNYAPSTFEHYNVYRRESGQSVSERVLLRKVTSPGQTTFLDAHPASDTEYIYSVSQTISIGPEELESDTTDGSASVHLPHTVIASTDEADDYRVVAKYWTDRGWEDNTDAQEVLPWGASKPTVLFGSVYYRTLSFSARFVDDDQGTRREYQAAVNALLARRGIVSFRDPQGRRIFGVLRRTSHTDEAMGTVVDIEFELVETNFSEGVE